MGYGLQIIRVNFLENGIPYLTLMDVLNLPNLYKEAVATGEVCLPDSEIQEIFKEL